MKNNYMYLALIQSGILLVSVSVLRAEPVEFEAELADGRRLVGAAVMLDSKNLTLGTVDGPMSLPTDELMSLSARAPAAAPAKAPEVWVRLVDGSSVAGAKWTLEGDASRITLLNDRVTDLPRRAIGSVRFSPATGALAEQWARLVAMQRDGDIVVVRKGDHLDFLRGVIRSAGEESIAFDMDGDLLPIRRSRLFGVILFRPAGRELPAAVGRITDHTGSEWSVQSLAFPGELQWTTPAGVTVSQSLTSVVHIDFSVGKVVYLADLEPQSVDWQPFFPMDTELPSRNEFFRPRRNRGLVADTLRLGGVEYERGLSMHSRSEVVYRLPDEMTRLKATAGIDDRVRPHGNVVLIIRGDGAMLFEETLSGTDPPMEIDLDVAGVRRLSILCDFGEGMDVGDHLNLCNLRVIR